MPVLAASSRSTPSPDALASALLALAGVLAAAFAAQVTLRLSAAYPLAAAMLFGGAAAGVVALAARSLPGAFGAANRVTLARAALTALLLALLGEVGTASAAWFAVGAALLALVLDGVDGRLARRQGTASRFGARFDMETDAVLILALAALAWRFDKAGAWVLLAGLMRYAFVAAGCVWPALRGELPPSRRRQTMCVLQIAGLVVCLTPLVTPPWSGAVALAALLLLTASFGADVAWLARHRDGR